MDMQTVKLSEVVPSPTNARPESHFKGAEFDDLVASVKEKGVLVPVLVRGRGKEKGYELIAGERRLRAALAAGLKEIPANVVAMSDTEAREAQIVENLQRRDIHPLDEGAAYRDLIEQSSPRYDVASVAAKVGKSEAHVSQRLVLTELDSKVVDRVRADQFPLGHAVVIARLPKADQKTVFAFATKYREVCSLSELRSHIAQHVFHAAMKNPPWKNDVQARAAIAKITGLKGGESNLFGEAAEEKIENPADYARALAAYITLKIEEYKKAGKPLTLVSGEYSTRPKGPIGRHQYNTGNGTYKGKCKLLRDALIVEGDGAGKIIQICTSKACPAHNWRADEETPEGKEKAKAKRKKEIAAEKSKRDKDTAGMAAAVKKISWPLSDKHFEAMFALTLRHHASHETHMQVCKRRGFEVLKKKHSYGGSSNDYQGAIRKAADAMTPKDKAGLMFELLVPSYSPNYNENRASTFKKI